MPASGEPFRLRGSTVAALVAVAVLASAAAVVMVALEAPGRTLLPPSAASPWPAAAQPVDTALASAGGALFARSCAACHTVAGGHGVGPDLAGLLERRDPAWIRGMVLFPDSMLRADTAARALLAEFALPMPAAAITERELRAIVEHVRAGSPVEEG